MEQNKTVIIIIIIIIITIKCKVLPAHAMKAHKRSRGLTLLILNLATKWRSGSTSRFPGRFTLGKDPRYPMDRGLGWPHSLSGLVGNRKISFPC
jgi:hypothetical protein